MICLRIWSNLAREANKIVRFICKLDVNLSDGHAENWNP
jgi:hypothetical protein